MHGATKKIEYWYFLYTIFYLRCNVWYYSIHCTMRTLTVPFFLVCFNQDCGPEELSRYSDWLRAGRSGVRIPVWARFSAPVQTGPRANTASCTMGTGCFPGVNSGRGVTLTPHPPLVPWSWKSRAIPLISLWAVRPVQSLSACTRGHFTFTFTRG